MPDAGEIKKRFISPFNFFFSESVKSKHTSQITVKSLKSFTSVAVPSHNLIRHVPYHNSAIECHDKVKSRSQVKISDAICSDEGLTLDTSAHNGGQFTLSNQLMILNYLVPRAQHH